MTKEAIKVSAWGLVVTLTLALLIIVSSRNLTHFDAELVAYIFATLFAAFGITCRYAMWLQRPPTALYGRRDWAFGADYARRLHALRSADLR